LTTPRRYQASIEAGAWRTWSSHSSAASRRRPASAKRWAASRLAVAGTSAGATSAGCWILAGGRAIGSFGTTGTVLGRVINKGAAFGSMVSTAGFGFLKAKALVCLVEMNPQHEAKYVSAAATNKNPLRERSD